MPCSRHLYQLDPDAADSLSAPALKRYLRKHIAAHTKAFPGYAQKPDIGEAS